MRGRDGSSRPVWPNLDAQAAHAHAANVQNYAVSGGAAPQLPRPPGLTQIIPEQQLMHENISPIQPPRVWPGKCNFTLKNKEAVQTMHSTLFSHRSRPFDLCRFLSNGILS